MNFLHNFFPWHGAISCYDTNPFKDDTNNLSPVIFLHIHSFTGSPSVDPFKYLFFNTRKIYLLRKYAIHLPGHSARGSNCLKFIKKEEMTNDIEAEDKNGVIWLMYINDSGNELTEISQEQAKIYWKL